jgi:uncharacterized protein (TIGR03435 family)
MPVPKVFSLVLEATRDDTNAVCAAAWLLIIGRRILAIPIGGCMRIVTLTVAALCAVTVVGAQQAPPLRFDVASVKPSDNTGRYSFTNVPGGGFRGSLPLEWLIGIAFDIRPFERIVGEPGWARTQWFDIDAKPARDVTADERKAMLRTLLEERFGLVWRKDPTAKDMMWALTLAREDKQLGPGIRVSECVKVAGAIPPPSERQLRAGQPVPCGVGLSDGVYAAGGQSIRVLASTLQLALGEEIIDRTGLSGSFDFHVTLPRKGQTAADVGEPSIFTAIQEQLGMRLQREEIIRDAFVVVSVWQPTPN